MDFTTPPMRWPPSSIRIPCRRTLAVIWSGTFNFLGVLVSSGAVAFGIVSLLPVELILQVSSGAGFAMVFALLIAAILWNLGTWYFGLPSSSSHTLIGSIIGVGLMNQLMAASGSRHQRRRLGSGDQDRPNPIGLAPDRIQRGVAAAEHSQDQLIRIPALYKEPEGNKPPPIWIRGLLILTCTGVSFFHGGNDGQKGMGLDHADPHRHSAYRLCAQSHHARKRRQHLHGGLGASPHRPLALRARRRSCRSAGRRRGSGAQPHRHARGHRRAQRAHRRHQLGCRPLPLAGQGSARLHGQYPQRDVPAQRGTALHGQDQVSERLGGRPGSRSIPTKSSSIIPPSSSRPGSRSLWRSLSAWAR